MSNKRNGTKLKMTYLKMHRTNRTRYSKFKMILLIVVSIKTLDLNLLN